MKEKVLKILPEFFEEVASGNTQTVGIVGAMRLDKRG